VHGTSDLCVELCQDKFHLTGSYGRNGIETVMGRVR
jgi:hypothetical protein